MAVVNGVQIHYVIGGHGNPATVSVISGQDNSVIRTIPCCVQYTYNKIRPWGIAFDSTNGNLYVTGSAESPPVISSGGVSVISGQNNTRLPNIIWYNCLKI